MRYTGLLGLGLAMACDRAAPARGEGGGARGAGADADSARVSRGDTAAAAPSGTRAPARAAACSPRSLALSRVSADAGAGQRDVTFALTNVARVACALAGYPRLTFLGADGRPVAGVRAVPSGGAKLQGARVPDSIFLDPGEQATFSLGFTGIQADDRPCARVARLLVALPEREGSLSIAAPLVVCVERQVQVTPLEPARAAVAGVYGATRPAADAAARSVTLRLAADGVATLTTGYAGRGRAPPERGRWSVRDSVLTVRLAGAPPLVYVVRGGNLVPLAWDTARYGRQGLPLERRP